MGFFNNRKKKKDSANMSSPTKKIYEYKVMETVDCDLDAALAKKDPAFNEHCHLIAETEQFEFYSYATYPDNSGGYVLRRNKSPDRTITFFGDNKQHSCIYQDSLFQSNHSGERGRFYITARNIYSGEITQFNWLGKGDLFIVINGYGRCYCQDSVEEMYVKHGRLYFKIKREKSNRQSEDTVLSSNEKYDRNMEYTLEVEFSNGKYHVTANYPTENIKEERTKVPKNTQENHDLGRDESKHISCKYVGREDDCQDDCSRCPISIKTKGDALLALKNYDQAINLYKKALFLEPGFAEAWVNLGNCYGWKGEYHNALSAFDKAIVIDPRYGNALYGKAITLKNLGKIQEALDCTETVLKLYDNPTVRKFKTGLLNARTPTNVDSTKNNVNTNKEDPVFAEAIRILDEFTEELITNSKIGNHKNALKSIKAVYYPENFTSKVLRYCQKQYSPKGEDKVHGECLITSYYGAICSVLLYQVYPDKFIGTDIFGCVEKLIDVEFTDLNAEHLLGTRAGEERAEKIWDLFTPYLSVAQEIFHTGITINDELLLGAMENAYTLGMLVAIHETEAKKCAGTCLEISSLFHIEDEFIGKCVRVNGYYFWPWIKKDPLKCELTDFTIRGDVSILVKLKHPLPISVTGIPVEKREKIEIRGILRKYTGEYIYNYELVDGEFLGAYEVQ